jgi:hypothetical protein
MSFGKRPSTSAVTQPPSEPPPPDPHGRRKVFDDELWQGEHGNMLRMLGLSPDDESNLVPNASSVNAEIDRRKAAHDVALAEAQRRVQSTLADAQIRSFSLIPDAVWNSQAGAFLIKNLSLYPYDTWNIMYLAADERTALTLDLAPHPGGDVPAFVQASQEFMANAQAHLEKVRLHVMQTQNWQAYTEAQDDVRERVRGIAALFARRIAETWAENSPNRGARAH